MTKTSISIPSILRTTALVFISVIVLILLLTWAFSPLIARLSINDYLSTHKLQLSKDSEIRLNPFLSRLSISDLSLVDSEGHVHASIDSALLSIELTKLINKQIYLSKFELNTVHIELISNGNAQIIAGFDLASFESGKSIEEVDNKEPEPMDYKLRIPEIVFTDFKISSEINHQSHELNIVKFSAKDIKVDHDYQNLSLDINGNLNTSKFEIYSSLTLKNQEGVVDASLILNDLDLSNITRTIDTPLKNLAGSLNFKTDSKLTISKDSIAITLNNLKLETRNLDLEQSPWLYFSERNSLLIEDAKIIVKDNSLNSADGRITLAINNGNLALDNKNNLLSTWELLELNNGTLSYSDEPHLNIGELNIHKLVSLKSINTTEEVNLDISPISDIEKLSIYDVALTEKSIDINAIEFKDLKSSIILNEDKTLQALPNFSTLATNTNESRPLDKESDNLEDNQFSIKLNEFSFSTPGKIYLLDKSVNPPFERTINVDTLKTGPINNQDLSLVSPFEIKGKLNTYSTFSLDGGAQPFTEKLNLDLKMNLKEISLPDVSSYIKDSLGFEIQSGQLNNDLEMKIVENKLLGDSKLFIAGLKMSSANNYEQNTIKEGTAMPLNTALNLLKDGDDNLKLKVPISGDVSDPSFGLSNFTALILRKAAMRQTKSYLINTFVPYANVVTVALTGANYLLKIRFEPMEFSPGQLEIDETQSEYLLQLVKLLQDKPKLRFKTCAISVIADANIQSGELNETQTQQLIDIGLTREENLKAYLVTQEIDSSRILFCTPKIEKDKNAKPQIILKSF